MALIFRTLHATKEADALNQEWMILENTGANAVTSAGCALTISKKANERPHPLGTLDPGFVLQPQEKVRLVTGTPSKKSQGAPPAEDGIKNYHLFLKERVLRGPGTVVRISLKQHELAKAVFAPTAKNGIED